MNINVDNLNEFMVAVKHMHPVLNQLAYSRDKEGLSTNIARYAFVFSPQLDKRDIENTIIGLRADYPECDFYSTDGRFVFDVRDKEGRIKGFVCYLIKKVEYEGNIQG